MKKSKLKATLEDLYNELYFYKIAFENSNQILTQEVLEKHFLKPIILNKSIKKLHNEFFSFNTGVIGIALKDKETLVQKFYIGIEKDAIYVACNCGMPSQELCEHAFYGLGRFIKGHSGDFKSYYWPGIEIDNHGLCKYLDIKISWHEISIHPKKELGRLFITNRGFDEIDRILFDEKRSQISIKKNAYEKLIGYHFIYNANQGERGHCPFLMPFIGIANNTDDILSYETYLMIDDRSIGDIPLTNDQILLNDICYKMLNLALSTRGDRIDCSKDKLSQSQMVEILELWKQAIPLIKTQPYVKGSYSFGMRNLPEKPGKKDIQDFKIDKGTLSISFFLKEHEDFFTLEPTIYVYEKDITASFCKFPFFIVDPLRPSYYHFHLVDNIQDDTVLEWFTLGGNKLTVLKHDFEEFNNKFLVKIREHYVVYHLPLKSRKKSLLKNQVVL
ncbi:hypothetical protein ABID99_002266 [Mucilaginibacter sp. OAE612]|uniref:hypothetical protein n=1 Tax=Mucilaginibacter sp. OAE612 TaxID=3156444 RepID=UPI00359ECDF4